MQPYLFPYIGYFQLIAAADKFIIYDDVNFIKQGWINRNQILANSKSLMFSVPLTNQSSFQLIKDTEIHTRLYSQWQIKFKKTLNESYCKATNFEQVLPLIENVFNAPPTLIADLCKRSLETICHYLEIQTQFVWSSEIYENAYLTGQNRVLDICKCERADSYFNSIGGLELYDKTEFAQKGIKLDFIKSKPISYKQLSGNFIPYLSIIDVLMFNSKDTVRQMLSEFEIL